MSSSRTTGVILAVLGTTLGITSWLLIDKSQPEPSRVVSLEQALLDEGLL